MDRSNNLSRFVAGALVASLTLTSACDKDVLQPPTASNVNASVRGMFERYVALGNSITAGFQSGGLTRAGQMAAYPALLAQQMGLAVGTDFNVPLVNDPGCPPPYSDIFTQQRVAGLTATDCFARVAPIPEYLNNVAVPGAEAIDVTDVLSPNSNSNVLTTLVLGGRTQAQVAREMDATFVTVWIGSGDALDAITDLTSAGDASLVTDPADFAARYDAMMQELDAIPALQGGALIGAVQVGLAPYVTQGRAWAGFEQLFDGMTAPLNAFDVNANCLAFQPVSATDTVWTSVPFHLGAPLLSMANARIDSVQQGLLLPQDLQPVELDCSVPNAITVAEGVNLVSAVTQYNTAIAAAAAERDWIYLDPNLLLATLAQDPTAILPLPAFDSADPQHATEPFGWALSLDGIHPSDRAHVAVANALIDAINAKYDITIPSVAEQ
jgi:hypothetical protein